MKIGFSLAATTAARTARAAGSPGHAPRSGEREEEPFQLGAVGLGGAIAVGGALLQAGGDDLEAGPVQGAGRRGELGHHVGAVAAFIDHPDDPADLALGPAKPLDHARHRLAVHIHDKLPVRHRRGRHPMTVVYPRGYTITARSATSPST